jgi:hypothetical protein
VKWVIFLLLFSIQAFADCVEKDLHVVVDGEAFEAVLFEPELQRDVPVVFSLAPSVGRNPLDGVIASDLCKNSIATVLVEVYSQDFMNTVESFSAIEARNRFSMQALRQLIDTVATLPEIDGNRMGMIGSSLGGIFGALYFPSDDRLLAYVNILGAENIPEILTYSDNHQVTAFRNRVMAEKQMRSANEFLAEARAEIVLDPAKNNTARNRDKILQVMLETDETVPFRNQLALWERTGRPDRILLTEGDHTDQYIDLILYNFRPVVDFLKAKLRVSTRHGRGTVHRAGL